MNEVKKCVDAYQSFIEKLAGGFMNAASEGTLTASIGLTHSQISGSFLDRSYFETIKARMRRLSSQDLLNPNEQMPTTKLLIEHPDLYQMLDLMEKGAHECIHALQKHSYRSVVTLVNAMQTIENWEAKLFFSHMQSGGTWDAEGSFLQCLECIDDEHTKHFIARNIRSACNVALEAFSPRQEGLSLAHLIEGQAYVAGRLAVRAFEALPPTNDSLYTLAWSHYEEAGGHDPMLFVLIAGAAMRFGDINDDDEGSFRDFYPNPVDIFIYLLKYVPTLEKNLLIEAKPAGSFFSTANSSVSSFKALDAYDTTPEIDSALSAFHHLASDSPDPDLSYLLCKSKPEDFDDEEEMRKFRKKLRSNIMAAFGDEVLEMPNPDTKMACDIALMISKQIAGIVGRTYSRVAEPTTNAFKKGKHKKIADAVGEDFSLLVRNANSEDVFLQSILDQSFLLGTLFPYFLDQINERVSVQLFDNSPPISHIDYRSMLLMPEMIKGLLAVYQWRHGEARTKVVRGPYCCEKHGHLSLGQSDPIEFDNCSEEDSLGNAFRIAFGRSITSCIG